MDEARADEAFTWRGAIALGTLVGGGILLGCLASPWVFEWLVNLGRTNPRFEVLREVEFRSVTTRLILVLIVLGLWPALAFGRIRRPRFGEGAYLPRGLAIGVVSMALLVGVGHVLGVYRFEIDPELRAVSECLELIVGAMLVGLIEEFLFRGLLFDTLRRATRFWPAAAIGSAFFAVVHFAKPEPTTPIVHGHADSGLELARHMFYMGHESHHYFPFMLTLFVLGLVLCRVVERTGSLWYAVGLHAGWVFAMRLGGYLSQHVDGDWNWLYGISDKVEKSYAALFLLLVFLLWFCLPGRKIKDEEAEGRLLSPQIPSG